MNSAGKGNSIKWLSRIIWRQIKWTNQQWIRDQGLHSQKYSTNYWITMFQWHKFLASKNANLVISKLWSDLQFTALPSVAKPLQIISTRSFVRCSQIPYTVVATMEMEEFQALCTTYANINLWSDGTKKCLIHYGYIIEQPQRVVDIFKGHELPCQIDHKFIWSDEWYFYGISFFSHQIIYWHYSSKANLMSEVSYRYSV